jgi:hypothetical protein
MLCLFVKKKKPWRTLAKVRQGFSFFFSVYCINFKIYTINRNKKTEPEDFHAKSSGMLWSFLKSFTF